MATAEPNWQDQISAMKAEAASGMDLTIEQRFDIQRMKIAIDATNDVTQLREISKQLLEAWQTQKAATRWAIAQQTGWNPHGLRDHPINRRSS